jgi:hypothetical protein
MIVGAPLLIRQMPWDSAVLQVLVLVTMYHHDNEASCVQDDSGGHEGHLALPQRHRPRHRERSSEERHQRRQAMYSIAQHDHPPGDPANVVHTQEGR